MKRPGPLLFGKYRLVERIAQSEIAHVFEARSSGVQGFEKPLVIKLIRNELTRMPAFAASFEAHAKRALSLSHANVVQVFDFGQIQGTHFMAMEQVCGCDLAKLLAHSKRAAEPLPASLAVYIASELARALDYAHRRRGPGEQLGVVHGSVCPSSVLLSNEGEVKLANFGLGRALQDLPGSERPRDPEKALYMSPEQASGEPIDGRSDIFSLGTLLYECLTGLRAFEGVDAQDNASRVRAARYPALEQLGLQLPLALRQTVHKALQIRPEQRQDTAGQLCDELCQALGSLGPVTSRDLARYVATVSDREPESNFSRNQLAVPRPLRRDCTVLVLGPFEPMRAQSEIDEALARYGGRALPLRAEEQWGSFVFGLEHPDGEDADAALCFLRTLRLAWSQTRPALASTRAGGHSGTVWLDQAEPDGASCFQSSRELESLREVARAAAQSADPGASWLSTELVRQAADSFLFRQTAVPGTWAVAEENSARRAPARFVGREASLRRFGDLLARACRSAPNRIVIEGETGIGKSRLLDEAISELRAAGHEVPVFAAQLRPGCHQQPLSGLAEMLRAVLSVEPLDSRAMIVHKTTRLAKLGLAPTEQAALESLLLQSASKEPEQEALDALGQALAELLRALASKRLSLFLFDASEYLDPMSLGLLDRWLTREQLPNAVFLFLRTSGSAAVAPLWPEHRRLELGPLSLQASRELLSRQLELGAVPEAALASLLDLAAGNPLFIEQYAAAFAETGRVPQEPPRRVRGAFVQRIAGLGAEARVLLELCALVDSEIEIDMLAELLGWDVSRCAHGLTELLNLGLLMRTSSGRYLLKSLVLVGIVRAELPRALRHELHLGVAQLMERRGDWPTAIAQLEAALDAWPRSSDKHSLHLELYHRLGSLCVHTRASERGASRMVAALDLADALGRDDMAARFCMLRSELLAQNGQFSESREWRERAQQKNGLRQGGASET